MRLRIGDLYRPSELLFVIENEVEEFVHFKRESTVIDGRFGLSICYWWEFKFNSVYVCSTI